MTTTPTHDSLAAALAAFQAELPRVGKAESATIPGKEGQRGYSYRYADLHDVTHAVTPVLARHGLSFTACPTVQSDRFVLAYALTHTTGEALTGAYPLPDPTRATAQQVGSAITYARRYCLSSVTGVVPDEDDDGAQAGHTQPLEVALAPHQQAALDAVLALAPDDQEALRTWVQQEGHGHPRAWTKQVAQAITERAAYQAAK